MLYTKWVGVAESSECEICLCCLGTDRCDIVLPNSFTWRTGKQYGAKNQCHIASYPNEKIQECGPGQVWVSRSDQKLSYHSVSGIYPDLR